MGNDRFEFIVPAVAYEGISKAGAKQRRIAGVISLESVDHEGEAVLQNGLDFDYFLKSGVFNDNHSQKTEDVLGWPSSVQTFRKGQTLPDGTTAPYNCTWAEGVLSNRKNADAVWELARDMSSAGRSLGFSIEGAIQKRVGPNERVIAKCKIINCAITPNPVNADTKLITLARSLWAAEHARENEALQAAKAVTAGYPGIAPGTNAPNMEQDFLGSTVDLPSKTGKRRRKKRRSAAKKVKKSLTFEAALQSVVKAYPSLSVRNAMVMAALVKLNREYDPERV